MRNRFGHYFLPLLFASFLVASQSSVKIASAEEPKVYDFDLQDVSVADFAELVNSYLPKDMRVICSHEVAEVTLPRISGLRCSPIRALLLLEPISANTRQPLKTIEIPSNGDGPDLFLIDFAAGKSNVEPAVVSVARVKLDGVLEFRKIDPVTRKAEKENLGKIINEALEDAYGDHHVKVRFHESVDLLFLLGPKPQTDFVKEIVKELSTQ